jgi:hypothetical protein
MESYHCGGGVWFKKIPDNSSICIKLQNHKKYRIVKVARIVVSCVHYIRCFMPHHCHLQTWVDWREMQIDWNLPSLAPKRRAISRYNLERKYL